MLPADIPKNITGNSRDKCIDSTLSCTHLATPIPSPHQPYEWQSWRCHMTVGDPKDPGLLWFSTLNHLWHAYVGTRRRTSPLLRPEGDQLTLLLCCHQDNTLDYGTIYLLFAAGRPVVVLGDRPLVAHKLRLQVPLLGTTHQAPGNCNPSHLDPGNTFPNSTTRLRVLRLSISPCPSTLSRTPPQEGCIRRPRRKVPLKQRTPSEEAYQRLPWLDNLWQRTPSAAAYQRLPWLGRF